MRGAKVMMGEEKLRRLWIALGLAVTKTCNGIPCNGTDNEDVLRERRGHDRILAYDDNDLLDANNYSNDRDVL
jgi:hypothetical protein